MDELQALRAELDELHRDNESLRDQVRLLDERLTAISADAAIPRVTADTHSSRRTLLRVAGAGAVGLVAGAVGSARPAAASNGEAIQAGFSNTAENQTRLAFGAAPLSIGGRVNEGIAMLLVDSGGSNGYALDARGGFHAIRAKGSTIGVASYGEKYAFAALASETAAIALGETVKTGGQKLAPIDRIDAHARGELDNDGQGNLWWCVASGNPGQWRKLAGPASAGAFHPVTPTRVYDSRLPTPSPGRLQSNESRRVRVADGRDLVSGAAKVNDIVPVGATAITGNLTVAATENGGYLAVNEGGNPVVSASALNWSSSGQVLSNSFVVKIDVDRNITVIAGGGSAHVIVDVTGYYI